MGIASHMGTYFFDCRAATLIDCGAFCDEKGACEAAFITSEGHLLMNKQGNRRSVFDEAAYIYFSPTYFLHDDWYPFANALGQAFTLIYYDEVCVAPSCDGRLAVV